MGVFLERKHVHERSGGVFFLSQGRLMTELEKLKDSVAKVDKNVALVQQSQEKFIEPVLDEIRTTLRGVASSEDLERHVSWSEASVASLQNQVDDLKSRVDDIEDARKYESASFSARVKDFIGNRAVQLVGTALFAGVGFLVVQVWIYEQNRTTPPALQIQAKEEIR